MLSETSSQEEPTYLNPQFGFTTMRKDTLKLILGPNKQRRFVPGEHLIRNSKLVRHLLKTLNIGSRTGTVFLPSEDEESFSEYLRFVFSDKLPTEAHSSSDPLTWEKSSGESYDLLAELYVIGERMIDRRIQDAVMRELVRLSRLRLADGTYRFPGNNVPFLIYEATTHSDPARRLLVQMYARFGGEQWVSAQGTHPTFAVDLAQSLLQSVGESTAQSKFRHTAIDVEDYLFANEANAESRLFQTKINDFYTTRPTLPPLPRIKLEPCPQCHRGY